MNIRNLQRFGEVSRKLPTAPGMRVDLVPNRYEVDTKTRVLSAVGVSKKMATEIKLRAERRFGEVSRKIDKGKPGPINYVRAVDLITKKKGSPIRRRIPANIVHGYLKLSIGKGGVKFLVKLVN